MDANPTAAMPTPTFLVLATWTVREGELERVTALLPELAAASRAEPGCRSFDASARLDDPHTIVLVERYETGHAFAEHRETEHYTRLVTGQIVPLLADRRVEFWVANGD
jgi:quinol monooxygenase YgiN